MSKIGPVPVFANTEVTKSKADSFETDKDLDTANETYNTTSKEAAKVDLEGKYVEKETEKERPSKKEEEGIGPKKRRDSFCATSLCEKSERVS